ncbi:MAG: hypothetical protein MI717_14295 [Spirochaetales bacterium]|nr:hypothetical protein [Spirochaetales bacterium]
MKNTTPSQNRTGKNSDDEQGKKQHISIIGNGFRPSMGFLARINKKQDFISRYRYH